MSLPALEFLERRNVWVGVIQRDHEPERYLVILLVVEEAAAPRIFKRPAL